MTQIRPDFNLNTTHNSSPLFCASSTNDVEDRLSFWGLPGDPQDYPRYSLSTALASWASTDSYSRVTGGRKKNPDSHCIVEIHLHSIIRYLHLKLIEFSA